MKIIISGEDFNRIMKTCMPALARMDSTRETLKYIEIRGKDYKGTATALDGYMLSHCSFEYEGEKECHFMLPKYKTVKNDCFVTITVENGEISISDGEETLTRKSCASGAIDTPVIAVQAAKEPGKRIIGVSRAKLRKMLDCYRGDDLILLEIPENTIKPIVIRNSETWGMLLPYRMNAKPHVLEYSNPLKSNEKGKSK